MTVEKILEMIDTLAPNNCLNEQKLYWYNQCESIICNKAIRRYTYFETEIIQGIVKLPDGYSSEDIESVYIDGEVCDKLDFISGFATKTYTTPQKIGVVVKEHHNEIVQESFAGTLNFSGDTIIMENHPFVSGNSIDITSTFFTGRVTVLGTSGDSLYVNRSFEQNECTGTAVTSLNIEVNARPPYDRLYIDYILAQMDYYNKDFEGYNNNSYMFNELLDELICVNEQSASGTKSKKVVGIW
ncbi:MAG: hypothetical protein Q8873_02125 [Bacillota bacterium]|nr:hypothetical protein [Bacillota bacterium]